MNKTKLLKVTIRKKLLVFTLFLLVVPVVIVGAISYEAASKETDNLIEKNIQNNVQMALTFIDSLTESVNHGLMTKEEAQEKVKIELLGAKADGLRPINKKIDLGVNGYFFITDEKGKLLAHPSLEGQSMWDKKTSDGVYYIQDMIKIALDGGGLTKYRWPLPNSKQEAIKEVYSAYNKDWGWVVVAGSYMQDFNKGQKHILNNILITLAVCFVIGLILVILFARHIANPLLLMTNQTTRIAEGDLSGQDAHISNKDEVGMLGQIFSKMKLNLRSIVSQISTSSDQVSDKSTELSHSIEEVTAASKQIAASVEHISQLTQTQAINTKESSNAMEEMAIAIQKIAETSSIALEASQDTAEEAERGNQLIEQTSEQMLALRSTVQDLATVIETLSDRSVQIDTVVQVITEIANQTNLLALNAAIEAARAGESGKGFSVVASEVRKLAERSSESAREVSTLISSIQENIAFAVTQMKRSEGEVDSGVRNVQETGEAFKRIFEATRSVVNQIQEASASSEELSAGSEQIAASLQDIYQMSKATATAAQSISGFTTDQLQAMQDVQQAMNTIGQMTHDLQETAHRFKL